jgi:voltage-gated potassium channel
MRQRLIGNLLLHRWLLLGIIPIRIKAIFFPTSLARKEREGPETHQVGADLIFQLPRRYLVLLVIPAVLVLVGTVGYYLLEEKYTLFDALYMTVITLTTVGYGEVLPLGRTGRWFTIFLLLGGVCTLFYVLTEMARTIISGELKNLWEKQVMERKLAAIEKHMIVCGFGRMGKQVCHEFSKQNLPFVIIDRLSEGLTDFAIPHGIAIVGDATSDEVLRRAGVDRARALVTVAASDADNLYITMSARLLNDSLFIVARAEAEGAEAKLMRAGANRVVAPYLIGGSKVAQAVMRPTVVDFIELATQTEHLELQIEETVIAANSQLAGVGLSHSRLRQDYGLIIVAIKRKDGAMVYTPPPSAIMEPGDTLIALGRREQLDELERVAGAKRSGSA